MKGRGDTFLSFFPLSRVLSSNSSFLGDDEGEEDEGEEVDIKERKGSSSGRMFLRE